MKRLILGTLAIALAFPSLALAAAALDRSTITQVVKDVSILETATKRKKAARVSEIFSVPDVMRTGAGSRAEMIAEDQTVTRLGANTVFSFDPAKRVINLEQGSILFDSPSGRGGGTIRTAAATASVPGTTLIVATTRVGGFKLLMLEGRGKVKSSTGQTRMVSAGQMIYALPGGALSEPLIFRLGDQVGASLLVNGFKQKLPSQAKIEKAVASQERSITRGQLVTTELLAGDDPTKAYKVDLSVARDTLAGQQLGGFAARAQTDAVIANPELDRGRIFSLNLGAFLPPDTGMGGTGASSPLMDPVTDFSFFIARNTTVRTPSINLSPFPGTFVFFSLGDFIIEQGVRFDGAPDVLAIIAAGTLQMASGTMIDVDTSELIVFTLGLELTDVPGLINGAFAGTRPLALADVDFVSTGDITVIAPGMDLQRVGFLAQSEEINLRSSGDIAAVGFGLSRAQFRALYDVTLDAAGDLKISNSVTATEYADFTAGRDVSFVGVAFTGYNAGTAATSVNITANNFMGINGAAFQAIDVSLQARTLSLQNVNFVRNSNVTLRSETGLLAAQPNTGRPVELGKVNFIRNVNYDGQPAQNFVGRGITIAPR
jgi:hypothetical protein